ncbi:metal ABC transporter substrate-binding protein [Photobacterium kishitanii]|uniref:Metal ABC transporter substrate-binding protein n=1 Tax=Photobacterium kishitanii TaxID=318456 RepID=A0A2T3KGQ0_9GAMM|nr:metal ABC transporter substrate-binding protein [Photobacterium kishitanii]PSU98085.1 metal ABC transporter substrate-binding protein [Photobacterium kishitanii]PSV09253.1 metal ABC transporter substrate-binding protein [Photobacterium kishitanii]
MSTKYLWDKKNIVAAVVLGLGISSSAMADTKIPVVASFSILGDLVSQVGGEHVTVKDLVGINGDVHTYSPAPMDAVAVKDARLVVINGLGLEGWLPRLMESAHFKGVEVVASNGINKLTLAKEQCDHHHHGVYDPHAWNSVTNVKTYVKNIEAGLVKVDPANASDYQHNAQVYLQKLDKLQLDIQQQFANIPASQRVIITSHDAFQYFSRDYDVTFLAPQGTSTDAEASAADVANIINQVRDDHVRAVFIENITDNRMVEQISQETGAKIGGKLYSDALSGPNEPASSYIKLMEHNTATISNALK